MTANECRPTGYGAGSTLSAERYHLVTVYHGVAVVGFRWAASVELDKLLATGEIFNGPANN